MIVGHDNLKKLYPEFIEDIQENGIDLRIGELFIINKKKSGSVGCVNDKKLPPRYSRINKLDKEYYTLEPENFYFARIDRQIHIPKGYIQQYYLRSSFSRCGLILTDAIGDSDYSGFLMVGLYNSSPVPVKMGLNERIIQAITIKTDGTETSYEGAYQNNKLYDGDKNILDGI